MMKSVRNWLRHNKIVVGAAIIFFLIGFFIGLATRFELQPNLQFDDKIDPGDLLSIVTTIILAWIVTSILDKEKQTERTSKDILLKRLEELYAFIGDVASRATEENFRFIDATSAIKRINITLKSVYQHCESKKLLHDTTVQQTITTQVDKLNDLMTNTPAYNEGDRLQPAVRIVGGIVSFNKQRALQIENTFEDLKDSIISLELEINRS